MVHQVITISVVWTIVEKTNSISVTVLIIVFFYKDEIGVSFTFKLID